MVEGKNVQAFIENNQGLLFKLAIEKGLDFSIFIKEYMKSKICQKIDSFYSFYQSQSPEYILESLIKNKEISGVINKEQNVNIEAIEWLGFFYRRWHYLTGESSRSILKFLSPVEGVRNWYTYHQLDEKSAIYLSKVRYNQKRNNHRKHELKCIKDEKEELKRVLSDFIDHKGDVQQYYAYLTKRILYKLYREPIYNKLEYLENQKYDFVDEDETIGIKAYSIKYDDIFESNKILNDYKNNDVDSYDKSILFYIVLPFQNSTDSSKLEKRILEINQNTSKKYRSYNYLYFYLEGQLFEVNDKNELRKLYLPISIDDRLSIIHMIEKHDK